MTHLSRSDISHGPQAPTLPAVQRFVIAWDARQHAHDAAARAEAVMHFEEGDAVRAMKDAGIAARQRLAVRLLGGRTVTVFWDEAGLVVLD